MLAKFINRFAKLATNDLAYQYAHPVKSVTGYVLTKSNSAHSRVLEKAAVEKLDLQPSSNVLELGYGRGDGLGYALERVKTGIVFGIEKSSYMEEVARKRFIIEEREEERLRLDQTYDLRQLPYPSDFFDGIFHVDLYYCLRQESLPDICQELYRILKPDSLIVCTLQLERLQKLQHRGMLTPSQVYPLRYLSCLEPSGFIDVKMEYARDEKAGEYQVMSARKRPAGEEDADPDRMMQQLEMEVKAEMLAARMGRPPSKQEMQHLQHSS